MTLTAHKTLPSRSGVASMRKPDPAVLQASLTLLKYCRDAKWAGWDPYDGLNSRIYEAVPLFHFRVARLVLIQGLKRSPINLRPLLLIPKAQNAKALGLFLSACVRLDEAGVLPDKGVIAELVQALTRLRSPNTTDWCWGYHFPWQTRTVLVPRGAPNLVCTTFVAEALFDYYERTGAENCLEMALGASRYVAEELFWEQDGAASFAYPLPGYHSRVHNANLLAAALLLRAVAHGGKAAWGEVGMKAARYSVSRQNPDGSWFYGELPTQRWIDNFHTGFNLCALQAIGRYTDEFARALQQGFGFYRDHFFLPDGAPKYFHDRTYPLDVHSAAQSIITVARLQEFVTDRSLVSAVTKWTLSNLRDPSGYFYYQQQKWLKVKIPYMRWSQAWMLRALAELVCEGAADTQRGVTARGN